MTHGFFQPSPLLANGRVAMSPVLRDIRVCVLPFNLATTTVFATTTRVLPMDLITSGCPSCIFSESGSGNARPGSCDGGERGVETTPRSLSTCICYFLSCQSFRSPGGGGQ